MSGPGDVPPTGGSGGGIPPRVALLQLLTGRWLTEAIAAAARLGIADRLGEGPRPVDEVAGEVDADPDALYRLMRALSSLGLLRETSQERTFELTVMGRLLREDEPGSLRDAAIFWGGEWSHRPWAAIEHAVRTGEPAFEHVFDTDCFTYLADHDEARRAFQGTMTALSSRDAPFIREAYDFGQFATLVDVGGGHGTVLSHLLDAHINLEGILFDRPEVIAGAEARFEAEGLADRVEVVGGDFFEGVPEGGDAYFMRHIVHDWPDEKAATILANVRGVIPPDGRLLLAEMVIPPGDEPFFGKILDLEMLVMTDGGRERTAREYRALLEEAGFELAAVHPSPAPVSVIEGIPS